MPQLTVPVGKDDHAEGGAHAACTLVEYGDYQCPSCLHAFTVLRRVRKHFGEKLRFVFRNFPLEQHPMAEPAAEAAEFAAAHGKFWEMHDALYENQDKLSDELFSELAGKLGLDAKALTQALDSGKYTSRVEADLHSGEASGVQGTPTFYINGEQWDGGTDAPSLIEAIDAALRG